MDLPNRSYDTPVIRLTISCYFNTYLYVSFTYVGSVTWNLSWNNFRQYLCWYRQFRYSWYWFTWHFAKNVDMNQIISMVKEIYNQKCVNWFFLNGVSASLDRLNSLSLYMWSLMPMYLFKLWKITLQKLILLNSIQRAHSRDLK